MAELIAAFDLPQVLRHNARFDLAKLAWLNGEYLREMSDERFYEQSVRALARAGLDTSRRPAAYVKAALDTCKGKFKVFNELPAYAGFYFTEEIQYDPEAARREFTSENKPRLARLREALSATRALRA